MRNGIDFTGVVLSVLLPDPSPERYLQDVVLLLREWTGCECVGIRILREGGYCPYEAYTGFDHEFWLTENTICIYYDECACTRVVRGMLEPQDMPAVTTRGSFYTPNVVEFTAGMTEAELTRYRGTCIARGFHTVAIIPLYMDGKLIGSIHLADERAGQLQSDTVHSLEFIADVVGLVYSCPKGVHVGGLGGLILPSPHSWCRKLFIADHSTAVARLAAALGGCLGGSPREMHTLRLVGLLHDLGMLSIHHDVLNKQGELSQDEWKLIATHSEVGANQLEALQIDPEVTCAVRQHHERLDGSGYPIGLAEPKISFFAQVVAVADAFNAMVSSRPHRQALTYDQALHTLTQGSLYNQHIVAVLRDNQELVANS